MPQNILFLSVHPEFADKIFNGSKKVELRRIRPRLVRNDIVLIYVTSPISALSGAVIVEEVISETPSNLWNIIKLDAGVTWEKFNQYYNGSTIGFAILFKSMYRFPNSIGLQRLRKVLPSFMPPQGYLYLKKYEDSLNIIKKMDFNIHCILSMNGT